MVSRRTFLSLAAGSMAAPRWSVAQPASQKVALYANVGADLTHYDVDVAGAALTQRATITLPAGVQYAWPHVSRRYLYVATSSSAPGSGTAGTEHHVTALRIDPASGALTPHGAPIRLPTRPIHLTTDMPSAHIPTVCPSVASRKLLLYQSLPITIPYRYALLRRRKDDTGVGTASRGIVERLRRFP